MSTPKSDDLDDTKPAAKPKKAKAVTKPADGPREGEVRVVQGCAEMQGMQLQQFLDGEWQVVPTVPGEHLDC